MTVKPHDEVGVILYGTTGESAVCCLCFPSLWPVLRLFMLRAGTRNRLTANSDDEEAFDPGDFAYVTVRYGCHRRTIFVCVRTLFPTLR